MYLCRKKSSTMDTLTIRYDKRNVGIAKLVEALTHMKGISVLSDDELTPEEMKQVEKSRKSGILYDIDKLQAKLKS